MVGFTSVTLEIASSGILSVEEKRSTRNTERLSENTSPELGLEIAFSLCFACEFLTLWCFTLLCLLKRSRND